MLLMRIISALVGIPVVIGAVYLGGPWFLGLLLIVVNLAAIEYWSLLKTRGFRMPLALGLSGVSLFLLIIYFDFMLLLYPIIMLHFFILFVLLLFDMDRNRVVDSALSLWGIIYIGGLCGYMLLVRMLDGGAFYMYLLLFGVWIHDTLAYFIGVKWGVRKFAPDISPNKSVEGSLAGLFGTVAIFFSASILAPETLMLSPGQAAVLAFGIGVFAQLGDLVESALKRQLQVKDSGRIIPGHGGVLDRFDSLLVAAPFVYYFFLIV